MNISREQLRKIIEADGGDNWWKPDLFEKKIRSLLPTELEIISPPPKEEENYNCFVFAFGLQNDIEFLGGRNPIQQEFIKYLILNNILIPVKTPSSESLVFYKNEKDEITHAGIMKTKNKVISKWMWGPVIKHDLWDIPSSFGNETLFFKVLSSVEIKKKYNEYKSTGVYINPIE